MSKNVTNCAVYGDAAAPRGEASIISIWQPGVLLPRNCTRAGDSIADVRFFNGISDYPVNGNSVGTPVPKLSYWNCRASYNTGCPGGHVNTVDRIRYYDDLLEENTERALKGLAPSEEYKRLDYLTEKFMEQIDAEGTEGQEGVVAAEAEVMDFLGAFERLLGPELLEVN
jgi:hypothetical protein